MLSQSYLFNVCDYEEMSDCFALHVPFGTLEGESKIVNISSHTQTMEVRSFSNNQSL